MESNLKNKAISELITSVSVRMSDLTKEDAYKDIPLQQQSQILYEAALNLLAQMVASDFVKSPGTNQQQSFIEVSKALHEAIEYYHRHFLSEAEALAAAAKDKAAEPVKEADESPAT
jgi:hypothetical protein